MLGSKPPTDKPDSPAGSCVYEPVSNHPHLYTGDDGASFLASAISPALFSQPDNGKSDIRHWTGTTSNKPKICRKLDPVIIAKDEMGGTIFSLVNQSNVFGVIVYHTLMVSIELWLAKFCHHLYVLPDLCIDYSPFRPFLELFTHLETTPLPEGWRAAN